MKPFTLDGSSEYRQRLKIKYSYCSEVAFSRVVWTENVRFHFLAATRGHFRPHIRARQHPLYSTINQRVKGLGGGEGGGESGGKIIIIKKKTLARKYKTRSERVPNLCWQKTASASRGTGRTCVWVCVCLCECACVLRGRGMGYGVSKLQFISALWLTRTHTHTHHLQLAVWKQIITAVNLFYSSPWNMH